MKNFFGLEDHEIPEFELEKKKKRSPFDYVKSITEKKEYLGDDLSGYSQFLVSRALASYPDCILYVREMNMTPAITDRMHYDFFYHAIEKRKRFAEWYKKGHFEIIGFISFYYNVSFKKAEEFHKILTESQLKQIEHSLTYGVLEK
jgi:hypothetical protein